MRFSISVVVGALTIGSAATDAFINAFTESGCTGGENSIGVAAGECVSVSRASANQDKSQNGIKYTCDGYGFRMHQQGRRGLRLPERQGRLR